MSEIALQLEYSVEADVSPAFAWQFLSEVSNWNDPPAQFALDGPFEEGSHRATLLPGEETLADGMRRFAAEMVAAAKRSNSSD